MSPTIIQRNRKLRPNWSFKCGDASRPWKRPSVFRTVDSDGTYQKFRPLEPYLSILENAGFTLLGRHENPHSEGIGAMYVFQASQNH